MGLRDRLRRLEERAPFTRLRCPECREEFVFYDADPALGYLVHLWKQGMPGDHEPPADIRRLLEHEHNESAFMDLEPRGARGSRSFSRS